MLGIFSILAASAMGVSATTVAPQALSPVSYRNVSIEDRFWSVRQKALDDVTMRQQFDMLVKYKYRENFERAAERKSGGYVGYVFNDSDVYKVLEAGAYVLGRRSMPWLDKEMDDWIALIGKAQEPDGYLNAHFQLMRPNDKWSNLRDLHELYCAGHLFEAAAAHFEATGKRNLLDIAIKLGDHIDARFGPGKKMGYPGHPETELALFKLWRATGNQRYFNLAEFFLNSRGSKFFATEHNTPIGQYNGEYWSDHLKIREHEEIVGHAVRAAYLFSGATDLAAVRADTKLVEMLDRVWANTTERRMFITGGLGPSGSNEGFTVDYDLPTFTAYQESCASIANALWNYRMTNLHGQSKYADVMETALYNGSLSGINLAGNCYFYTNPLASGGDHHRPEWHACACCPPNLARIIGQVGGLAYSTSPDSITVNLYVAGKVKIKQDGHDVELAVKTDYPWNGTIKVSIAKASSRLKRLMLRKPGWMSGMAKIDGREWRADSNGYFALERNWRTGDSVTLELPMPARRVISHPNVKDTFGMVAMARGPLVYCVEGVDNKVDFDSLGLGYDSAITSKLVRDPKLGTIVELQAQALAVSPAKWKSDLFQTLAEPKPVKLRAIPYCYWDNRQEGPMRVWLSPNPAPSPLRGSEVDAQVELSFESSICSPEGVKDGFVPATSNPNSPQQLHFWPHKGGDETITYKFPQPVTLSSSRVFWFDDTGRGECRIPAEWRLEVMSGGRWVPVSLGSSDYAVKLDVWNTVKFAPVTTSQIRMVLRQQDGWASGVHEWQVF